MAIINSPTPPKKKKNEEKGENWYHRGDVMMSHHWWPMTIGHLWAPLLEVVWEEDEDREEHGEGDGHHHKQPRINHSWRGCLNGGSSSGGWCWSNWSPRPLPSSISAPMSSVLLKISPLHWIINPILRHKAIIWNIDWNQQGCGAFPKRVHLPLDG